MSQIRVLICRVDDPSSARMPELAACDLPATDVSALEPGTALDALETVLHLNVVDTGEYGLSRGVS